MAPHALLDDGFPITEFNRHDVSNQQSPIMDTQVLIIGGGPSGLLQAYMLSQLGVKSLVIERYSRRLDAPKAHALSPRSIELCRQFGLDVNHIRRLGTQREDAYWVNFVTSLAGTHVGTLPYERMDPKVLEDTPTMIHNIPQPSFEELIAASLAKEGNVEVRKNHSFVKCIQSKTHVTTIIEDREANETYQIRSRHLIACDGAKSRVRNSLGVECEGEDGYETMMTIHFNANIRSVIGDRPGMLHWIMDPEVSGFIIGYSLDDNQVLICNFNSQRYPVKSWNANLCRKIVTAAIGKFIPFDILSHRPWTLSRKVSKSYQVGNVFFAGDAAHSFPPTGGLGLNSGLGDVHNLAYKVAAVHQGWGSSSLLHTYHTERQPVALVNSSQSVKNGKKIFKLLKTLGMTDADVDEARRNLFATISDPASRKMVMAGIEDQREHFDNLALHIGYIYGDTTLPPNASIYKPAFVPGARLPHAWITLSPTTPVRLLPLDSSYVKEFTPSEVQARQFSTLDLCAFDAFTLIIAKHAASDCWRARIEEALAVLPSALKLNIAVLNEDFDLVPCSKAEEWMNELCLDNGGGVLVRPDQHILGTWRAAPDAARGEVVDLLREHLGLRSDVVKAEVD